VFQLRNWNKCPLRIPIFDNDPFSDHKLFGHPSPLSIEIIKRLNATLKKVEPVSGVGAICGPGEKNGARGTVVRSLNM